MHKLLRFALKQAAGWYSRPLADELGDIFLVNLFLQHGSVFLDRSKSFLSLFEFTLRDRDFAVPDFRHFGEFAGAFVPLRLRLELLDLLLELANFANGFLLVLPARLLHACFFFQLGKLLLNLRPPLLGVRVGFFQQRLALDFKLQDAAFDFVNLHGQRINLHAQAGCRFID